MTPGVEREGERRRGEVAVRRRTHKSAHTWLAWRSAAQGEHYVVRVVCCPAVERSHVPGTRVRLHPHGDGSVAGEVDSRWQGPVRVKVAYADGACGLTESIRHVDFACLRRQGQTGDDVDRHVAAYQHGPVAY